MNSNRKLIGAIAIAGLSTVGVLAVSPVSAHHSFALYNNEITKIYTGVVTRVNPDANHLQIFFAPMNAERTNVDRGPDGKPIIWAVEMMGSAAAADEGISVSSFPPGTIFSVGMHPLRSGELAGSRNGALFQCPAKTPPAAGKHCDSVAGSVSFPKDSALAAPKG